MGKTVIFGATGMVGAYTALRLKSIGHDVVAVGKRVSDNGFFSGHGIQYCSVDIGSAADVAKLAVVDVQYVLHFAGSMPAHMSGYHPAQYINSIVDGTYNVLEYCRRAKVERIVFSQSCADSLYLMGGKGLIPADIEKKFPLKGDHAVYAICKNCAVDLVEHYYHQYGLKRFVLRLPTIYAYHPNPYYHVNGEKKMRAYCQIMEQAFHGLPIEVWGDCSKVKEMVYVKDLTQIVEKALVAPVDGGMYNVGRGVGVSLEEQIKGIVEVFSPPGHKSELVYRPDKPYEVQFVYDISKTVDELGYEPAYDYMGLLCDFKKEMELARFGKLWGVRDASSMFAK